MSDHRREGTAERRIIVAGAQLDDGSTSLKDQSAEGASSAEDQGEDLHLPRTSGRSSCVDDEGSRRIPASAES